MPQCTALSFIVLFCIPVVGGGCGRGVSVPKYPVSGAVTFDGSPVEKGSITFDAADMSTPPAMGGIENGRYQVEVPEGEKIIRIDAVRASKKADQYGSQAFESFIPREYNEASKLRATVSPTGVNQVDVTMESNKAK